MADRRTRYVFAGGDDLGASRSDARAGGFFRAAWGSDVWESLTHGLPANIEARAVAIHPENPEVIFVGAFRR